MAFLSFNRFACVPCFNPIEPNSEINGHRGHQAKPLSKNCATSNTNPVRLSLHREGIVAEAIQVGTGSEPRIWAHLSAQTCDKCKKQTFSATDYLFERLISIRLRFSTEELL